MPNQTDQSPEGSANEWSCMDIDGCKIVKVYKPTTLQLTPTAFLIRDRDSVENKPASFLVVSLDKTLNGMPPSLCGTQVVGPSSLPIAVAPVN